MNRKTFLKRLAFGLAISSPSCLLFPQQVASLAAVRPLSNTNTLSSAAIKRVNNGVVIRDMPASTTGTIAYKTFSLPTKDFPVEVPVACWFPADTVDADTEPPSTSSVTPALYQHRISVRRIGELLAGWDFIPDFVSRKYSMTPSLASSSLLDGRDLDLPKRGKVVVLAHGYLGSRFDLSHLAEELAQQGFTCLAAEYPESLAASYDRYDGLDRRYINAVLLDELTRDMNVTAYGIVGHSLGCGTVQQMGDDTWARVSIAGFPRIRDGSPIVRNGLFVASMNDGATRRFSSNNARNVWSDGYELLDESLQLQETTAVPKRAALVLEEPNHISFLAENVNDAMIEFLSPLLPVAQAFSIPVLDFDKYQISRDSKATAEVVHPLIVQYLKQEMSR